MTKKNVILKTIYDNPELNKSDIWNIVKKKGISDRHFRRIYGFWEDGAYDDDTLDSVEDLKDWTQEGDKIVLLYNGRELKVKEDLVNRVFQLYTKMGLDETASSVMSQTGLNRSQFKAIQKCLQLTKASNPISPSKLEGLTAIEQKEVIEDSIEEAFNRDMGVSVVNHRNKQYKSKLRGSYLKLQEKFGVANEILDHLELLFTEPIQTTYSSLDIEDIVIDEYFAAIGDPHIGADVKGREAITSTNLKTIEDRFSEAAEMINQRKAGAVTVLFTGDILESFTGNMHEGSYLEMNPSEMMANSVFKAVDIMKGFLGKINNLKAFRAVAGNHDRIGSKNFDQQGQMALIIYEILKRVYDQDNIVDFKYDTIPDPKTQVFVEYDPLKQVVYSEDGELGFIVGHGDKTWINRVDSEINKIYRTQRHNPNVIIPDLWVTVSGHVHHNGIIKDGLAVIHRTIGAVFAGNFYSKAMGLQSRPTFSGFYRNDKGVLVDEIFRFSV